MEFSRLVIHAGVLSISQPLHLDSNDVQTVAFHECPLVLIFPLTVHCSQFLVASKTCAALAHSIVTMRYFVALLSLLTLVNAQFGGFFDQMFNQQGGHEQRQQQQQNNPSDASHYKHHYEQCKSSYYFYLANSKLTIFLASCDHYLCPDTLACVHFPHHCPCAWESQQEKFELAEGQRICVSRGGFQAGEAARKIELARKGLL
jgi:hypothetical protein